MEGLQEVEVEVLDGFLLREVVVPEPRLRHHFAEYVCEVVVDGGGGLVELLRPLAPLLPHVLDYHSLGPAVRLHFLHLLAHAAVRGDICLVCLGGELLAEPLQPEFPLLQFALQVADAFLCRGLLGVFALEYFEFGEQFQFASVFVFDGLLDVAEDAEGLCGCGDALQQLLALLLPLLLLRDELSAAFQELAQRLGLDAQLLEEAGLEELKLFVFRLEFLDRCQTLLLLRKERQEFVLHLPDLSGR